MFVVASWLEVVPFLHQPSEFGPFSNGKVDLLQIWLPLHPYCVTITEEFCWVDFDDPLIIDR